MRTPKDPRDAVTRVEEAITILKEIVAQGDLDRFAGRPPSGRRATVRGHEWWLGVQARDCSLTFTLR